MKTQFINQIKPGDMLDDVFVLSEITMAQKRDGASYLNITLTDRSGRIKGVVWENVQSIIEGSDSGDFVTAKGSVSQYRDNLQVVLKDMVRYDGDDIDPADFLPASSHDIGDMLARLQKIVASLQSTPLKALLTAFFSDSVFVEKFSTAPAAKKMHHAYIGGLLEHTLSMAILADKIAGHYGGVDREMLIAGAILHDIGKIKEFQYQTKIDYTDAGRLINHIPIALKMIDDKLGQINDFPSEIALLIKHMVVSHHGLREFGSPEIPKTIEAVLLHYIDEIDSKTHAIREFMENEESKEPWTAYHRLLERHFYKGHNSTK
jgi:3'-5' exoribonuclease